MVEIIKRTLIAIATLFLALAITFWTLDRSSGQLVANPITGSLFLVVLVVAPLCWPLAVIPFVKSKPKH